MSQNLSSAAVVIGALRVKRQSASNRWARCAIVFMRSEDSAKLLRNFRASFAEPSLVAYVLIYIIFF